MNPPFKIFVIVVLLFGSVIYLPSCKKEETPPSPPVVGTTYVSDITYTTALTIASVTNNGGAEVTDEGVCWSISPNPTLNSDKLSNGTGSSTFTERIIHLKSSTKYYVRAYATNSFGISFGNEVSFTTKRIFGGPTDPIIFNPNLTYNSVLDVDGNTYKTIQIGTQLWMAENLKTTKLNDGTVIPEVRGSTDWNNLTKPAYCWYDNDSATYRAAYGALYNWYAVNTSKLCPTGWHPPTESEWSTLLIYLGNNASDKMREVGTTHWASDYLSSIGATNETGFTGLPGGLLSTNYDLDDMNFPFEYIGFQGKWWSATGNDAYGTDFVLYDNQYNGLYIEYGRLKTSSLPVRCLKD